MMKHLVVYREPGRFAGWPANFGMWSWGNEIVFGFTAGYLSAKREAGFHAVARNRPFVPMQARTTDGGFTWEVAPTPCELPGGRGFSADEHVAGALQVGPILEKPGVLSDPPGGLNFAHPDFALMCARSGLEAGARSWFYVSTDRCRSWQGPYALPAFGYLGVAARTDYVVTDASTCTLFLMGTKRDDMEGTVFCARTSDGGRTFQFHAAVGPEPAEGFAIMPATVRLADGTWLTAIRTGGRPSPAIEIFASTDDARTWQHRATAVDYTGRGGNPPALVLLPDGRLCVVYGYRDAPYGIRAVVSDDGGHTWCPPLVLRSDAGNHDIGYPRATVLPDGRVLAVYYYNDRPDGERYIAGTIFAV